MILEKLLESAGLMPGQEYSMQESTTLGDGSRLRPDAVVFLPEGKHLIIDSKVSLLHYEGFASSSDETERDRFLKLHVESLRNHARGLGEKDYTKLYGVQSVDFVLMFVPIEPAFLLALRERPAIFQEAYDRQVVMVTHSTLMATLRTIHGIWKNERVARNHMEIADRAGKLYEKFAGFAEDLIKVGKQLDSAQDNYKEAMNKLSKGPGNLVRQVEPDQRTRREDQQVHQSGVVATRHRCATRRSAFPMKARLPGYSAAILLVAMLSACGSRAPQQRAPSANNNPGLPLRAGKRPHWSSMRASITVRTRPLSSTSCFARTICCTRAMAAGRPTAPSCASPTKH
ncbi:MAG: DNA recombination protein RmuC [Flavobacteriales bacterium]|nr:DNA recombination protein RmuC [Flavobacteriales bacterium]